MLFLMMTLTLCIIGCTRGNSSANNVENNTDSRKEESTVSVPHDSDTSHEFGSDSIQDAEDTLSGESNKPTETIKNEDPKETTEPEGTVTDAPETQPPMPEPILFEEYQAMSGSEQYAYFQSFPSPEDFFIWYNAAVQDYQARNPGVEIGPGGLAPLP